MNKSTGIVIAIVVVAIVVGVSVIYLFKDQSCPPVTPISSFSESDDSSCIGDSTDSTSSSCLESTKTGDTCEESPSSLDLEEAKVVEVCEEVDATETVSPTSDI